MSLPTRPLVTAGLVLAVLAMGIRPMAAQNQTESQFISSTIGAITSEETALVASNQRIVFAASILFAYGTSIDSAPIDALIDYVDGLKAAGAQRVEFNPGVTSANDPTAVAKYAQLVRHIRQIGLLLAINPEYETAVDGKVNSFSAFQTEAVAGVAQLAKLFQPDYLVVVHEPTTMAARMGIPTTVADWDGYINAVAPMVKQNSPHTLVGAGDFYDSAEVPFFQDFVASPALDFVTVDIYDYNHFPQIAQWAATAHQNNKLIYNEETWAPDYLPATLPPNWQSNPNGLDGVALLGPADSDFAALDSDWIQLISKYDASNGMISVGPFKTPIFFAMGSASDATFTSPAYDQLVLTALRDGQLSSVGQTNFSTSQTGAIPFLTSLSSASYATVTSTYSQKTSTAYYPDATVAPDELISGYSTDLATQSATQPGGTTYPTSLGGTTITLVDSTNTTYNVPLYSVSAGQANYMIPSNVQPGPAMLTVTSADGTKTTGVVLVEQVGPGLYTASANGQGVAVGIVLTVLANGTQAAPYATFGSCSAGTCSPTPITLSSGNTVYVELFGTGFRHASTLTATVNGQNVPVQFLGAQGEFAGLDQLNIELPSSLAGSGVVNVVVSAQDSVAGVTKTSNTVTLDIQ
jgi:uncharacterized protein (TIGR03437 family)